MLIYQERPADEVQANLSPCVAATSGCFSHREAKYQPHTKTPLAPLARREVPTQPQQQFQLNITQFSLDQNSHNNLRNATKSSES